MPILKWCRLTYLPNFLSFIHFYLFLNNTLILNSLKVKNCCNLCCEKNKGHGRKFEAFRLQKIFGHQPSGMLLIIYKRKMK
jgi:hypothetical protein